MKNWAAALVVLCVAASARAQVEESRTYTEDLQRRVMLTVVRLSVRFRDHTSQGSGVCIRYANGKSYILTCAHVLDGVNKADEIVIDVFTRESYPNASRTYRRKHCKHWRSTKTDLGLLVADFVMPSVNLCRKNTKVSVGTPVLAVGCGLGAPPVCQLGRVTGRDGRKDYVVDRGAIGGRSGGALVGPPGLIGILARRSDNAQTFAVNSAKIHSFLQATGNGWLVPR